LLPEALEGILRDGGDCGCFARTAVSFVFGTELVIVLLPTSLPLHLGATGEELAGAPADELAPSQLAALFATAGSVSAPLSRADDGPADFDLSAGLTFIDGGLIACSSTILLTQCGWSQIHNTKYSSPSRIVYLAVPLRAGVASEEGGFLQYIHFLSAWKLH
jgi:hypothetical protein